MMTLPRSNRIASIFIFAILTCGILPTMAIRNPNEYTSRRDRRLSAPETTFRGAENIDRLSRSRTPVVVKLIDGEEVRGWIEYYDKDIIRITRDTQPNLFIYKSRVKYLYEDPGANNRSREAKA